MAELQPHQEQCIHAEEHRRERRGVNMPDGTPITPDTVYCGSCGLCLEANGQELADGRPGVLADIGE